MPAQSFALVISLHVEVSKHEHRLSFHGLPGLSLNREAEVREGDRLTEWRRGCFLLALAFGRGLLLRGRGGGCALGDQCVPAGRIAEIIQDERLGLPLVPQRAEVRADELVSPLKFVVRDGAAGAEVDIEREVVPVVLGERAELRSDVAVVAELVSQCPAKGRQVFLGSLKRHFCGSDVSLPPLERDLEPPPFELFPDPHALMVPELGARRFGDECFEFCRGRAVK